MPMFTQEPQACRRQMPALSKACWNHGIPYTNLVTCCHLCSERPDMYSEVHLQGWRSPWGEASPGQAQRVAVCVPLGLLHIQAHLSASCHCASCMA